MFLRKIDDGEISIEQANQEYEKFSLQIKTENKEGKVIKNPYYHIVIANNFVINKPWLGDKYNEAMWHFKKAIELDSE